MLFQPCARIDARCEFTRARRIILTERARATEHESHRVNSISAVASGTFDFSGAHRNSKTQNECWSRWWPMKMQFVGRGTRLWLETRDYREWSANWKIERKTKSRRRVPSFGIDKLAIFLANIWDVEEFLVLEFFHAFY